MRQVGKKLVNTIPTRPKKESKFMANFNKKHPELLKKNTWQECKEAHEKDIEEFKQRIANGEDLLILG